MFPETAGGKQKHCVAAPLQSVQSEWSAPPLATPTAPATPPPPPVPARTAGEGDRVEAIKGVRKAMLKIMTEAQSIPHFGYCDEVDVTELHALRLLLRSSAEQRGVRFSYMPVFIKVTLRYCNLPHFSTTDSLRRTP